MSCIDNCNGFILTDALFSLLLISILASVMLPLYIWVMEARELIRQEYDLLFELEQIRYAQDLTEWERTSQNDIVQMCQLSVVNNEEKRCVYALK